VRASLKQFSLYPAPPPLEKRFVIHGEIIRWGGAAAPPKNPGHDNRRFRLIDSRGGFWGASHSLERPL
jgi:hypothetical protein